MTYALAADFQTALFAHLSSDAALTALVGTAIFDALPSGTLPDLYVTLGAEEARDRSDISGAGARHLFTLTVMAQTSGFQEAKQVAAAICDALEAPALTLVRGHVVGLWFDRAKAERLRSGSRRVTLRFVAHLTDE